VARIFTEFDLAQDPDTTGASWRSSPTRQLTRSCSFEASTGPFNLGHRLGGSAYGDRTRAGVLMDWEGQVVGSSARPRRKMIDAMLSEQITGGVSLGRDLRFAGEHSAQGWSTHNRLVVGSTPTGPA
jgi:hypothetical protein